MMGLKPMMGLKLMDPKFSGDIGSVSEVSKTVFLELAVLEPVFSKPVFSKQLKKNQNL